MNPRYLNKPYDNKYPLGIGLFCRGILTSGLIVLVGLVGLQPASFSEETQAEIKTSSLLNSKTVQILNYDTFIKQVIKNHPTLVQARIELQKASEKRLEKQGAFDPYIKGSSFFNRFNSSSAVGKAQQANEHSVFLNIPTRLGAKIIAGAKISTGDIKTPVSPTGSGGEYYWGIELPLLQGLLMNTKIAAEKQALIAESMAQIIFQQKLLEQLIKANETYWAWRQATDSIHVVESLKDLADARLYQIKRKVEAGDLANIVAIEAQREVAKRNGQLAKAKRTLQKKQFKLQQLLWSVPTGKGERVAIEQKPLFTVGMKLDTLSEKDTLPSDTLSKNSIKEDSKTALLNRPELQQLSLMHSVMEVDKSLATNQLLPKLNIIATQGIETGDHSIGPVYRAGIQLNVPFRYRTPLGQRRQAQLSLDKLSVKRQQLKQRITIDVLDTVSQWEADYAQYKAAEAEKNAAKKLAQGERTRFNYGDTTLFLVNQRERAASEAELKYIGYKNKVIKTEKKYPLILGLIF